MRSETGNSNKKKLLGVIVLAIILLTFSWFSDVSENKNIDLASSRADFTLNSRPKINFGFHEGNAPEIFIEPISPKPSQEKNLAPEQPNGKPKINPADRGPGMTLDLKSAHGRIPAKKQATLPQIFKNAPKLEANQLVSVKLLSPRSMVGVEELLKLLRGFGDFINVPKDNLTVEFARRDKEIIQRTKEVYGNPENFVLGEQCGGEGAAWTYPPGSTTNTACGGDPEYSYPNAYYSGGGGSCNTDPPCFGTGFCFEECYDYGIDGGGYCYCWVPSCLGVCGFQSYIWDSTGAGDPGVPNAGNCACGADGEGEGIGSASFGSVGSGLLSGLGSSLSGGISSGILNSLGSSVLPGLNSSILSTLGSGILNNLGTNLASGLSSSLLSGISTNLLGNLTTNALQQALGGTLGSSIVQQLGTTAIQSLGSQLGANLSQGLSSQITGIIKQVVTTGDLSGLSSGQLISLGQKIGQTILQNAGANGISAASRQTGSGIAQKLGQQALTQLINQATKTTNP